MSVAKGWAVDCEQTTTRTMVIHIIWIFYQTFDKTVVCDNAEGGKCSSREKVLENDVSGMY